MPLYKKEILTTKKIIFLNVMIAHICVLKTKYFHYLYLVFSLQILADELKLQFLRIQKCLHLLWKKMWAFVNSEELHPANTSNKHKTMYSTKSIPVLGFIILFNYMYMYAHCKVLLDINGKTDIINDYY